MLTLNNVFQLEIRRKLHYLSLDILIRIYAERNFLSYCARTSIRHFDEDKQSFNCRSVRIYLTQIILRNILRVYFYITSLHVSFYERADMADNKVVDFDLTVLLPGSSNT